MGRRSPHEWYTIWRCQKALSWTPSPCAVGNAGYPWSSVGQCTSDTPIPLDTMATELQETRYTEVGSAARPKVLRKRRLHLGRLKDASQLEQGDIAFYGCRISNKKKSGTAVETVPCPGGKSHAHHTRTYTQKQTKYDLHGERAWRGDKMPAYLCLFPARITPPRDGGVVSKERTTRENFSLRFSTGRNGVPKLAEWAGDLLTSLLWRFV